MQVPRSPSRRKLRGRAGSAHPIGTPTVGISTNTGPLASAAWLIALDLIPPDPRWFVEIAFEAPGSPIEETAFTLEVYAEEWGFAFDHAGLQSWIRVTDVPFVHGRDEHGLLRMTPPLRDIGGLMRTLEQRYAIALARDRAQVRTNLRGAEPRIVAWAAAI